MGLFESGHQDDLAFVSELYHNEHVSKHSRDDLRLEKNSSLLFKMKVFHILK